MILYGKINEKGLLSVKPVREKKEIRTKIVGKDKDGKDVVESYEYIMTVEEQKTALEREGWKPADEVDPEKVVCGENVKVIHVTVDAGDRITYKYEKVINTEGIRRKVESLQKKVAESDYQIRKCYEYSLVGKKMPYDIQAIHVDSEEIRIKIRELKKLL